MHASRKESERAGFLFIFCFHCSLVMDWVSWVKGVPASFYSQ